MFKRHALLDKLSTGNISYRRLCVIEPYLSLKLTTGHNDNNLLITILPLLLVVTLYC